MSSDPVDIVRNTGGPGVRVEITPESAGWTYLSFSVVSLGDGESHSDVREGQETAIVPLAGKASITAGAETFTVSRESVFTEMPHIVYAPPGAPMTVVADGGFEFAIGSAPAEGKYPVRLIEPSMMKSEVRGGGAARRQVNHVLAPPIDAERLILYEVYVPRGTWSGWAPHRHDGVEGSPYLEETYFFRLDPGDGFAMHRNWAPEDDMDEILLAHDGDVALVPKGYHSSVACPSSHMMFLNYLAGELVDKDRITPPCFHEAYTWIQDDWEKDSWTLPVTAP
ncbi:MAG: 5-deoxy-glucuronate isomerase [Acidimicrobiales bacterium]|nr:5-deoxy-glucuronate isomerase [Acidimicrobiales bacterium]RZV48220.1 MAG: 5-deoxy-glucuronate isomerase [Acidimicrobiales bacterium]